MRQFKDLTKQEKKEYLTVLFLLPFAYIWHLFRKAKFRTLPRSAVAICLSTMIIITMLPIMSIPASAASYTTVKTSSSVDLIPKIYEYSSDSNQESVAFSNFTYREEKAGSTFATGNEKKFRAIASVYHVGEDVRVPAYSVAVFSAVVGSHARKTENNNAQYLYAAYVDDWETSGSLNSLYIGQVSNRAYGRTVTESTS